MSQISDKITDMIDMLPEEEQNFAYEFVKRLVLAWDPDYSKATPAEATAQAEGIEQIERGETVKLEDLDWS